MGHSHCRIDRAGQSLLRLGRCWSFRRRDLCVKSIEHDNLRRRLVRMNFIIRHLHLWGQNVSHVGSIPCSKITLAGVALSVAFHTALDPSSKPVNGLSLTSHNGGFQGKLKRGYGWWIGFLVSSLGSQTEFRLAEQGSSAVISSARFVPCLQDICLKKKKKERLTKKNFMAFGWWEGCWAEATIWWLTCWFINLFHTFTLPKPCSCRKASCLWKFDGPVYQGCQWCLLEIQELPHPPSISLKDLFV